MKTRTERDRRRRQMNRRIRELMAVRRAAPPSKAPDVPDDQGVVGGPSGA